MGKVDNIECYANVVMGTQAYFLNSAVNLKLTSKKKVLGHPAQTSAHSNKRRPLCSHQALGTQVWRVRPRFLPRAPHEQEKLDQAWRKRRKGLSPRIWENHKEKLSDYTKSLQDDAPFWPQERDKALSLWKGSTDPKTLDYQRTNPRECQILRTHKEETTWI